MKLMLIFSLMFVIVSCGAEKKTKQKSLQLSALQSSGLNLGSDVDDYGRKIAYVLCEDNGAANNSQRLSELSRFKSSLQNGSYENFTLIGNKLSPSQMISLLDQAVGALQQYQYESYCPNYPGAPLAVIYI